MSEIYKGFIISIVVFLLWSAGCFWAGYILSNSRAVERINEANKQLADEQQRYDDLIRETDDRIRNIKDELYNKISNNGETISELSKLIEQIRKQRIDI